MAHFPDFPDAARLWVYTAERDLTPHEAEEATTYYDAFLTQWQSHGRPVRGQTALLENRFLLLAAYIPGGDISGCGIDASVHAVETLGNHLGVHWTTGMQIAYRGPDGQVQLASRPAFRALVAAGDVTADTPVFDTALTTLGALRQSGFERPAHAAWHARLFRIPQPA